MYKTISSSLDDQTRADIVIGLKNVENQPIEIADISEVIEVKRFEEDTSEKTIMADFDKLSRLREEIPKVRLFQVIVGQRILPDWLFTQKQNVFGKNVYSGTKGLDVRLRRGKKAFPSRNITEFGVFAVLAEVL